MKSAKIKPSLYIDFNRESNKEDPKLEAVDLLEYRNIKKVLQKVTFKICSRRLLLLRIFKILCREHIFLAILIANKLLEGFMKNNFKDNSNRV